LNPARHASGFTLIEMVVSAAIMSIIVGSAYVCLQSGLASQKLIQSRDGVFQIGRVAMSLMTADLRNACTLSKDYDFVGMRRSLGEIDADNVDFATHHYTPRGAHEADFCEISYFVQKDTKTGELCLFRRRDGTRDPEPLAGGSREEIARGVAGLRFEYYDGFDWFDEWGDPSGKKQTSQLDRSNISGLPEAVRVTLLLDANSKPAKPGAESSVTNEPPFVFQTVVRLELAGAVAATGSSGSGGSSSPANNSSSPSGTVPGGVQ
jgi:type II secretion system protein J